MKKRLGLIVLAASLLIVPAARAFPGSLTEEEPAGALASLGEGWAQAWLETLAGWFGIDALAPAAPPSPLSGSCIDPDGRPTPCKDR